MTASATGRVSLLDVTKSFGDVSVIHQCSFDIPEHSFTALVGPSGCGKTTLIDIIAGYEPPTGGNIALDGIPITGPGWDRLVVFQETALFPWKSTLNNVMFGPLNRGVARSEAERAARNLLAKFGLEGFESRYPSQLSGGMQRRAELARALINSPKVMLLDEPFRGLDAMTRELMQEYLLRVFEEHRITTIFVTTEIEEAVFLADRIVLLSNRPATVKRVVEVDLPRPRSLKMLSSQRFGQIHGELLESLLEEASKAFSQGLQEAADMVEAFGRAVREGRDGSA